MAALNRREFLHGLLALSAAGVVLSLTGCGTPANTATPTKPAPPTAPVQAPTNTATAPTATPVPATPTAAPVPTTPTATPVPTTPTARAATATPAQTASTGSKVLLAYFSRAGENYYYGGRIHLDVGNTEVLAGMISRLIGCDVHRIAPVNPYPEDYGATVAQNVREQNVDARPAIANRLASIVRYDIVLLGSPIWNVRAPMIMSTFVESFDFSGKTVFPFTTHAGSGLGTAVRAYGASCPGATIGQGLAVRGEAVLDASDEVVAWLRRINLLK